MHRIDSYDYVVEGGKNKFSDGDVVAGRLPTVLSVEWLNDVQEELAQLVETAGQTLTKGTAQLAGLLMNRTTAQTITGVKTFADSLWATTTNGIACYVQSGSGALAGLLVNAAGAIAAQFEATAENGWGAYGWGLGKNSHGVHGKGTGEGAVGVYGTTTHEGARAIVGESATRNTTAVVGSTSGDVSESAHFVCTGTGSKALTASASANSSVAVEVTGADSCTGLHSTSTSGAGLKGTSTNGNGVEAVTANGIGLSASATGAGTGLMVSSGASGLPVAIIPSATRGHVHFEGLAGLPSDPVRGDFVFDSNGNCLRLYLGASLGWHTLAFVS